MRISTVRGRFLRLCTGLVLTGAILACVVEATPTDLRQGAHVITYMAAPMNLKRSMFMGLFPNGKPSQFVSFIFSSVGSAEWPYSEEMAQMDPMMREQAASIRMPLVPAGVSFTDHSPKSELGRQIVVRFDDARNVLIVEGYEDPTQPPVLSIEKRFRLPTLQPHERELLERLAQSNLEMGGTAPAF